MSLMREKQLLGDTVINFNESLPETALNYAYGHAYKVSHIFTMLLIRNIIIIINYVAIIWIL